MAYCLPLVSATGDIADGYAIVGQTAFDDAQGFQDCLVRDRDVQGLIFRDLGIVVTRLRVEVQGSTRSDSGVTGGILHQDQRVLDRGQGSTGGDGVGHEHRVGDIQAAQGSSDRCLHGSLGLAGRQDFGSGAGHEDLEVIGSELDQVDGICSQYGRVRGIADDCRHVKLLVKGDLIERPLEPLYTEM